MKAPCKDCQDRHVGCHADCERYQAYAKVFEAAREKRAKRNDVDYFISRRIDHTMMDLARKKRK